MPIRVDCQSCRASFDVGEEHAGRRGKCPRCKEPILVPPAAREPASPEVEPEEYALANAPTAGAAARKVAAATAKGPRDDRPTRPARTPVQILAAFRGEIRPVRPTLLYRLWSLIVAVVMLFLPMLYVALIALVGFGLYLHATTNHVVFQAVRNAKVAVFLYAGPLFVGGIVIAFMLKPLFARSVRRSKVRRLDPTKEPLIFAFVDGVCSSVGAPTPSRIEVDCEVNASAQLASGPLMPSRELVLTIGLPLVTGLGLKQFAGVLAHEFGHFSQGAGMRLSYLIRSINMWFARVVYERDEWDETLAGWSGEGHVAVIVVAALARSAVWLTRRVLWVLMVVGHAFSGFLSRQMEFDADRYEARMVGGGVFAATAERLGELNLASNGAYAELSQSWRERRLPEDLPRLIAAHASRIPDPVRAAFREALQSRRTGLFDTHPADRDRVARALAEASEGIFTLDGPVTDLFRDFDVLAKAATFDHYRALLGPDVTRDQLYPLSEALLNHEVAREGQEAFGRYFLDVLGLMQPLPLPTSYPAAPADLKAAKRELIAAREAMQGAREENLSALGEWDDLHARAVQAESAVALLKAGNKIKAADFGLTQATLPAAESARDAAEAATRGLSAAIEPFGRAAARRLRAALGLLESDAVTARVPDGAIRRDEARALYPCAVLLGDRIVRELPPLASASRATLDLVQRLHAGKDAGNEPLINAILRGSRQVHERLTELRWKIGDGIAYPFEHAQEGISLGRFALPSVPASDAVADVLQAGGEVQDRLLTLHHRILGRLAVTAEAVERVVGLPPLQVPDAAVADADA